MIICPSCGAQNDPANRFCDQCGTRLAGTAPATVSPTAVSPDQPTTLAQSCPACGATVLPGERFCDNCGADLMTTPIAQPSIFDHAPASAPAPVSAPQIFCPDCGDPVLPGERFCDNCGADLSKLQPATAASELPTVIAPPPASDAPTVIEPPPASDAPTVIEPPPASDAPTVIEPPPASNAPTVIAPPPASNAPTVIEPSPAMIAPPASEQPVVAATPAAPAPAASDAPAAASATDVAAERARLEALLVAHREAVAQYEQMAARYPAGSVPAFITAGLEAAKAELAKTEADLAALPSGPDPAEVARLETLLTAHRDTVAQYEQMAARYPAGSVPAFITAGLEAAKAELAKTEAELAALTGTAPVATLPASAAHPAAPTPLATPVPALPPAQSRLVFGDGREIILPADKSEYVIGREDPVSNIFPEIDLTSYGGEAGGVSRQHAKIVRVGQQWTVIDLNSTNHTRVNGVRIEPQTPTNISDGTTLQFGKLVVTFRINA